MVKKIKAEGPLSEYKEEKLKKKSNIPNVKVWLDAIRDAVLSCKDDMIEIRTDMVKMMEEIDKISMSVRVLATRLNRVDGMGKWWLIALKRLQI